MGGNLKATILGVYTTQNFLHMRKLLMLIAVLLLCSVITFAQVRLTSGRVTDQQGVPVPFVTIRLKGARTGTSADADGSFSIKTKPGDILIVSGTGFATKEIQVDATGTVMIQVSRKESSLSEVVVTAMGVKRSRNSLPYAAQQISGDDVSKTVTTNVVNNLSGKIAGLQVTASNSIGGSSNVILRGFRSLTQSNQALFVVDGVPYDNSITTGGGYDFGSAASDLNPDDIASISVLKGAAASALYGSRGINGVILITTKKGLNKNAVNVTASFGIGAGSPDNSTMPKYQTQYGEGYDATTNGFIYEGMPWLNNGNTNVTVAPTPDDAATGPLFDPSKMVYNWDAFSPTDPNFHKATPWQPASNHTAKDYFVTPLTTSENILVQTGGESGSFKFTYTRTDEKGFMPNSNIKKNLFGINTSRNLARGLTLEAGLNYVNENATNRGLYQYTGTTNPMTDFRQWWPSNVSVKAQKNDYFNSGTNATWNWQDDSSYQHNTLGSIGTPAYHDNLYWFAYQNPEVDGRNRYTGHARANWSITDYLTISGTATEDYYNQLIEQRNDIGSQAVSFYTRQNLTYNETNYNLTANFNKNISSDFNLKVMLGGNIQKDDVSSVFSSTNGGLILPHFWSVSNSVKTPGAPTEYDHRKEINSVLSQLTLSYKDMITLDGTLRRDETSTLPKANNVYYYPSVAGNFVFSKLLNSSKVLSYGKVWVNYAQVGGDAPYYSVYNTYQLNTPISSKAVMSPTLTGTSAVNNNQYLVPEKNNAYEAGVELTFLDGRIGATVDYYHAVQKNEILPINVSTATGYNQFSVNGGSVQNQGVEATINFVPVKTRDFNWNMTINWSKNMNKVLSLYGGQPSYAIATLQNTIQLVAEVGKPYGIIRGTDYKYLNGQKVISPTGYYEQNANTLSDIGSIQPDWIGGINNSFTYKNFTFSFLVDFHQGGNVYSLDMDYGSFSGLYPRTAGLNDKGIPVRAPLADGGGIILKGVLDDGKTPNTTRIEENQGDGSWTFGSNGVGPENKKEFVYSASFIKLREAALSYSLPKKLISNIHPIKGIDLSISGRNLWIIHKNMPYSDPEQGQAAGNASIGFQNGAYPSFRMLNFILKAKF